MKFRDIPQYIETGSWECNYSFDGLVKVIENWSNGIDTDVKLEMNPDFQRGYVWVEQQQIAFIESMLRGGAKNARVIYLNNPNWMRNNDRPYKDFVCVDGLQRYTAIKKFMNNEIKVFGYYYDEFEDKLRLRHDMRLNVNDLPTKKDVLQWYIEHNSGGTIHTEEEINKVKRMFEQEDK
jgi:uncharacterized protein with ParB-like and HNH nuclease domain